MPRNVRNFWIEVNVDGRKSRIATGPIRKDGGFQIVIKQRDRGGVVDSFEVTGFVNSESELLCTARQVGTHHQITRMTHR